jgi:DNA-binding NarL/FixJ family response regulator
MKKILVAEDEFLPAAHLRSILAKAGYEVVGPTSTAEETVNSARANSPDYILLDIRLAGEEDGLSAARRIREFSQVPIIFMSGYQEESYKDRAQVFSPLAFLVKPVLLKDIEGTIQKHLQAGERGAQ